MDILDRIGLQHPLFQAGLGGGLATADLAAAVSGAGALGTIGIRSPQRMLDELQRAHQLAPGKPIAVNLLLPFTRRQHVAACIQGKAAVAVLFFGLVGKSCDSFVRPGLPCFTKSAPWPKRSARWLTGPTASSPRDARRAGTCSPSSRGMSSCARRSKSPT